MLNFSLINHGKINIRPSVADAFEGKVSTVTKLGFDDSFTKQTLGGNDSSLSKDLILDHLKGWSLPKVLRARANERPNAPALQFECGEILTYAALTERVETFAANLSDIGVKHGDRIAIMMENSTEALIAWMAVNFLGAVEVPINLALRGRFLAHVLQNCTTEMVIIDADLVPSLTSIQSEIPFIKSLVVNKPHTESVSWIVRNYTDLTKHCEKSTVEKIRQIDVSHDDPAAIMYTSGTTGPAKGVLMPHGQMYVWAGHMKERLAIKRDDTFFVVLPLFHANAQIMQIYAAILAGAKVALYRRFSTSKWVDQTIEAKATVTSLLGVMAQFIFDNEPNEKDAQIPITRMIAIPMPAAIDAQFCERFGVECIQAYGMTEVCLPIMQKFGDSPRPGSCGRPLDDWYEVSIVDPETDLPVPPNTIGEIVVRPKIPWTMMLEYFSMPDRTLKAWRNLWFHTGDGGKCDTDGYYYFADRLQDRIRRRGENISSYELEAVATEYEQVLEAAAIAVPADEGEDDIMLCVVTQNGTLDNLNFLDHCKKRMPHFAVPRYFRIFKELPKTPNGKVLKRDLREHDGVAVWDRVAAGIHIGRNS